MIDYLHYYEAFVERVIDGDTIDATIFLGFSLYLRKRIRVARINTPEVRGSEKQKGLLAKEYVESLLPIGSEIIIHLLGTDSFGRAIAEIWYSDKHINLSEHLVEKKFAEFRDY